MLSFQDASNKVVILVNQKLDLMKQQQLWQVHPLVEKKEENLFLRKREQKEKEGKKQEDEKEKQKNEEKGEKNVPNIEEGEAKKDNSKI